MILKKALIIQNKFVGDVLVASILADHLKKIYPEISVHFFCYDFISDILDGHPNIDVIHAFSEKEFKKKSCLYHFIRWVRKQKFDIILDPYAKLQSRLIVIFSGARYKVSYKKKLSSIIYNHTYRRPEKKYSNAGIAIEGIMLLINPFKKRNIPVNLRPRIFLSEEECQITKQKFIDNGIDFSKPILMLGVLGSGPSKTWPVEYMIALITHIQACHDVSILLNYAPNQLAKVQKLLRRLPSDDGIFKNLWGKGIREFARIMSHCDMLIANEGGSIHIAKSLDKPTFTIYPPFIMREHWGCFEDGLKFDGVHLKDVFPEIYKKKTREEIETYALDYASLLKPEIVIPAVDKFLYRNRPRQRAVKNIG